MALMVELGHPIIFIFTQVSAAEISSF